MSEFNLSCSVNMKVVELVKGNELTSTMMSGKLMVGNTSVPFVLQKRLYGKFCVGLKVKKISIMICAQQKTKFTRHDYVSVHLMLNTNTQIKVYFKNQDLQVFLRIICESCYK